MRLNFSGKLFVIGLLVAPVALSGAPQAPPAAPAAPAVQQPAGAVPSADDAPRFPAGVEQVMVDVVVTDRKGNPIPDLPREAFTVQEDGTAQSIASFEAVKVPPVASVITPEKPRVSTNTVPIARTGRSFVIVFDDIHLAPFQAHRAKAAVAEFLKGGVREGDLVTLIATGGGVWWSTRMEAGRDELIALLKRLDGRLMPQAGMDRMSDYEAMRIHVYHDVQVEQRVSRRFETYGVSNRAGMGDSQNPMYADGDPMVRGRASEVYFQSVSRNRITLEVLERSLNALAASRGRKSLILVSEGFIYDPNLDEFKRVTQASRRSNVAMYFLDTRGLGGMPSYTSAEFGPAIDTQDIGAAFVENLEASEGAESLAADTGGFSVKNTNDLVGGIKRIAEESQSYYLVGYNASNTARDGRFRKIQVKVAGKGLKVRYRKGYYAPLDGAKAADKRGSDPQIQAALDSPYEQDDVPIRMTSYVMGETLLGKASVLVAADVDVKEFGFEEKEGRLHDTLEYLMVVAHRESGEFFRYDQKVEMKLRPETHDRLKKSWYGIVKDFELAPGGYQAKIVVRDKNKHQVGTVVHEFEVPDLTAFRVSTPILSDVVRPSEDNKNVPQPILLARRTFGAGATLYASFEVHGAAKDKKTGMPIVSAGYVIRRREGGVVTQSAPTLITPTSLGKVSRLIGAPLQGGPGDYELVITFNDTVAGKTLEVREPFSVAPGEAPPAG